MSSPVLEPTTACRTERHKLCGGYRCTCTCHGEDHDPELKDATARAVATFAAMLAEHDDCPWEQVGPCVYCTAHNLRLYQGELPERKRTVPVCAPGDHVWDMEMGQGFYSQCRACGFMEWNE